MYDAHEVSFGESPEERYLFAYASPGDIHEIVVPLLDLDRRLADQEAVDAEVKRLRTLMEEEGEKIAIARHIGTSSIVGYALVGESDGWSIGPMTGPNRMPREVFFHLRTFVDPEGYPADELTA